MMKKILISLCLLLILTACNEDGREIANPDERYIYIIEMIKEHDSFAESSNYFDISVEMAEIQGGYRYYITVDNPRIAMYDVELLAIEDEVDYHSNMAANVGIFENKEYNMVPNQTNVSQGYVKGVVASGISSKSETTLYVFVQFKNIDYSTTHSEYIKLNAKYEAQ